MPIADIMKLDRFRKKVAKKDRAKITRDEIENFFFKF